MLELIIRTVENKIKKEEFLLVEKLIDIGSYPVINVLDLLLQDKSTKKISFGLRTHMKSWVKVSQIRHR